MAEKTSYLSYEGLQTLVNQIKAKFALDASLKLTDGSLSTHIADAVKHITAEERTKWNSAATAAGGAVSKTDYDAKVKEIDGSISAIKEGKADKATTLSGYGITDAYTQTQVNEKISALGSVFSFKGTKANVAALPAEGNKTGDVWHVTEKSAEYVWDGDKWEELGSTVDLSTYAKSADVANTYATKAEFKTLNDASTSYEKSANKVDDITKVVESEVSTKYPSVKAVKAAIEAGITAGDTRVKQNAIITGESPILMVGAAKSGDSAEANYDANVKINAATGTLTATAFKGNLTGDVTGNADSATKATQDADGNVITATYATKTEVADRFTDPTGTFAGKSATATEATKASQDGNGKVIADTYATKEALEAQMVTAITPAEVEALFA